MMKQGKSPLWSKRFFLYSSLTMIMLVILITVNIIFSSVREQNLAEERAARFDSFVKVYSEDYSSIAHSLTNLSNNSLVHTLRYNSEFSPANSAKLKALVNALSFADSTRENSVRFFVYFHDSDRVVGSEGCLWRDEFVEKYQLAEGIDFEGLKTNRSNRIGLIRQAVVYKNYSYSYRAFDDLGMLYTYTDNGVTVLALALDAHIYASIDNIMRNTDCSYAIWDSETGLVLYSNMESLKEQRMNDSALIEEALGGGSALTKASSGRFVWYLYENNALHTNFSYQISMYMITLTATVLFMMALYYLTLEMQVFQPLKRILKTLPTQNKPMGIYEEIEEALMRLGEKDKSEEAAMGDAGMPPLEEQISQSILGIRHWAGAAPDHSYLCVGVAAETQEEQQAAVEQILETTGGKLLCVIAGFSILYLPLDAMSREQLVRTLTELHGRVAVGISREHTSISEARQAYSETADVFRMPCTELPVVYRSGEDALEYVSGLPLGAREAEALLGDILRGNSESALTFVNQLLDKTASCSIKRKRYVAGFLLELFELVRNGVKKPLYDPQEIRDTLDGTLDYEVMRAVVTECCESLARFCSPDDDSLISFMTDYVETHYQENINLQSAAELSGFSYAYVSHYFSEKKGMSFTDYLNSVRVSKAKALLEDTDMLIGDISERTGFGSLNTFARNFRKFTGTTPDAYRKAAAQNHGDRKSADVQ